MKTQVDSDLVAIEVPHRYKAYLALRRAGTDYLFDGDLMKFVTDLRSLLYQAEVANDWRDDVF